MGVVHKVHKVHTLPMTDATNTAPVKASYAFVTLEDEMTGKETYIGTAWTGMRDIATERMPNYTAARAALIELAAAEGMILHSFQGETHQVY